MDQKEGVIEIQGDKRELIAKLFTQKAFHFKTQALNSLAYAGSSFD